MEVQMRKFFLLATFFVSAPLVFFLALIFFLFSSYHEDPRNNTAISHPKKVAFAALPTNQNVFSHEVIPQDAREEILRQFFAKYKSPLEPHAGYFVKKAEEYNLDFRLLPAIAMQESNLCTKNRPESFNCWGFGVYGGKYLYFDNYEHAIDTISKALALRYRNKHGLVTPEEIQRMYTPSNKGSWAYSVNYFMARMK